MRHKNSLNRRTFLKGAAGVAVALPVLECMLDSNGKRVWAQDGSRDISTRYMFSFAGMSIASDYHRRQNNEPDFASPLQTGANYDLREAWAPFSQPLQTPSGDTATLQDYVSIVSGLSIPNASDNSGRIPPGGRPVEFHQTQYCPLFSGMSARSRSDYRGTSSDQLVANELGVDPLTFRVQAHGYYSGNKDSLSIANTTLSFSPNGGRIDRVLPTIDPRQAWQQLFGNFNPPTQDPAELARRKLFAQMRVSIVDQVKDDYDRLKTKLGSVDRRILDKHMEELRSLEQRVAELGERIDDNRTICSIDDQPGATGATPNSNWSFEDERAQLLSDIIYMAFKCDITRVATLCYSLQQSRISTRHILPDAPEVWVIHSAVHAAREGRPRYVHQIIGWHMTQWSYLLKKLAETPEGDGSMLDNCALVHQFEGGWGWDPEGQKRSAHCTDDMIAVIAGRAGGLSGNFHKRFDNDMHPSVVTMAAMDAVGLRPERFGEIPWSQVDRLDDIFDNRRS